MTSLEMTEFRFRSEGSYTPLPLQSPLDQLWSTVPLFEYLPKEVYGQLTQCSTQVDFEAGDIVFNQGDMGTELFVITEGTAAVWIDGVMKSEVTTGNYFGEGCLLSPEPRAASIAATSKLQAFTINADDFKRLGLIDKLNFPNYKMTKRHKMMAAGAAGVNSNSASLNRSLNKRLTEIRRESITDGSPPRDFWAVQLNCLKEIFTDKLNVFAFFFVPLGQFCKFQEYGPGIIFATNFCAIIPLANILGQATEALAAHTGQLIGGLLNATFGNAVEMIMCIQAVKAGLIRVVQGNLLGSILSNLLLVLGMAIFASGVVRKNATFNKMGAASNMSCQLTASISVCLPTCFAVVAGENAGGSVLTISRIVAVFLMAVYGLFLFFMLNTHADLFADEGGDDDDEEQLSPSLSVGLLMFITLVVFFASECLVDSIEGVVEEYAISKCFIGVILLPIVGNAAEHATAVTCAYKGMMDLALGVAVGSSTQIALFVIPCSILCGYYYDQPMDLDFSVFDTTCQMLTVFLVSQVLSNGSTNWLHGAMLVTVYIFIAVQTLYIKEDIGA